MRKRNAGELGLAPPNCICDPMDLAALGHMTNCPARVPGIGDPVEAKVMRLPDTYPRTPQEVWLPATVVSVDDYGLGVAFSDGERLAIPIHRHDLWRRA